MALNELDGLYDDLILDHCRNPRNPNRLDDADITGDSVNPFCGDEVHLDVSLDGQGRVAEVGLQVEGCSINQATGSMLSEAIKGRTLDQVAELSSAFYSMMRDPEPTSDKLHEMGDLEALAAVRLFPVRIKCALLAWNALDEGLASYSCDNPS